MKTIVHVWTQNVYNLPENHFWGLGDMIRGTYGLYLYAKKNGYNLVVDTSLHPVSQYLEKPRHIYSELVAEMKDRIYFCMMHDLVPYITGTFTNSDVVVLATNCNIEAFSIPAPAELQHLIKTLLTPTPEFDAYCNQFYSQIPYSPFTILHVRLGDDELLRGTAIPIGYEAIYECVKRNSTPTTILLSDSASCKKYIQEKGLAISMFDTKLAHTGVNKDPDAIRDTLMEFLLLTKASSIQSFSIYGWKSGFVSIAERVYNVPLRCITLNGSSN
jgi:hypothetical protein